MADHAQTITNSLSVLAASPGSLWNEFLWNETWGQDEDLWTGVNKSTPNEINISSLFSRETFQTLNNTISLSEDLSSVAKSIGVWDYVFTKPTTSGLDKVFDDSSKVADDSTSWTPVSDGSSTWSDV